MNLSIAMTGLAGLGAILCTYFAWSQSTDRTQRRLRSRLRSLEKSAAAEQRTGIVDVSKSHAGRGVTPSILQRLLPNDEHERGVYKSKLIRAGIESPKGLTRLFLCRLLGLVLPFTACFSLGQAGVLSPSKAILFGCVCGIMGWIAPSFWLDRRIARRQHELRRALPDFMDLMIVCLQSGLSVPAALQRVADEISVAHPELAHELAMVQRDMTLGAPIDGALHHFAERSGLDVVRILATFIRESRRFGSEIIEALRSHAEAMRFQREQAAEENAQKASVKILFPMLLLILPAVFVVLAGPAVIQIQKAFADR